MTDQHQSYYLAIPLSGKGAGVLVLHAWWGLTDFIRGFCDRLAQEGFVALAPDLFSGQVAHTVEEAERLVHQLDQEQLVPPAILAGIDELNKHATHTQSGLAVVGFSFGAFWALWLAQEKPEWVRSVILFYGTNGGEGDFRRSKAAFQGHFAENDPYETEAGIQELQKLLEEAGRPTAFFSYPGTGHWFVEEDRKEAYNAPAAKLAWERTISFLHGELDGS